LIATHNIASVTFEKNYICLQADGKNFKIPLSKSSKKLESANDLQRNLFTISPSDYGIHWPFIDEDLSIDALLNVTI
jgi:hypothetical protein